MTDISGFNKYASLFCESCSIQHFICIRQFRNIFNISLFKLAQSTKCNLLNKKSWSQKNLVEVIPKVFNTVKTQPVFTCSKLTIETLEQGVKYVQS